MVVVLTVLSFVSGGLLAYVKDGTKDKIEFQQLTFVKGPAIKEILKGATNDPIKDRFKLKDGDTEQAFSWGCSTESRIRWPSRAPGKGMAVRSVSWSG